MAIFLTNIYLRLLGTSSPIVAPNVTDLPPLLRYERDLLNVAASALSTAIST
jgi:hypothetical protein